MFVLVFLTPCDNILDILVPWMSWLKIKNFIQKYFFDENLVKLSRYGQLNSTITNFGQQACLLTSSNHDIILMFYDSCIFVWNIF